MKKKKQRVKNTEKQGGKPAQKVKLAMKNEFYLEAAWIMSSMLESRLKKLLAGIDQRPRSPRLTLAQTINRLKHLRPGTKDDELNLNIRLGLIDGIRNWNNQRIDILKDIPQIHVSQGRLERIAAEGARLLKEWKRAGKT